MQFQLDFHGFYAFNIVNKIIEAELWTEFNQGINEYCTAQSFFMDHNTMMFEITQKTMCYEWGLYQLHMGVVCGLIG